MHYRHDYHAGNFADCFKHALLTLLIEALTTKDAPLCYLDTHAGSGRYTLDPAPDAEHHAGIQRLLAAPARLAALAPYRALLDARPGRLLTRYPGSPLIAARLLRAQDRLVLCEQVPAATTRLRKLFASDPRVRIVGGDGYAAMTAHLPPHERRGLVLMDPPFEELREFDALYNALTAAHRRWPQGVYALWYPIKAREPVRRFLRRLQQGGIPKLLNTELCVLPDDVAQRLNGCGMVLVNPPWRLDAALEVLLPALAKALGEAGAGRAAVEWLMPP
jgi:23S rRNA (adenine2030-N6)-methyltransferase